MRNMAVDVDYAHEALASLETRLSAEEAEHNNTQGAAADISDAVVALEQRLIADVMPLENDINGLKAEITEHSLELGAQGKDIDELRTLQQDISGKVVTNTIDIANLGATKASKDEVGR
jgi:chromosome segregation ATPase